MSATLKVKDCRLFSTFIVSGIMPQTVVIASVCYCRAVSYIPVKDCRPHIWPYRCRWEQPSGFLSRRNPSQPETIQTSHIHIMLVQCAYIVSTMFIMEHNRPTNVAVQVCIRAEPSTKFCPVPSTSGRFLNYLDSYKYIVDNTWPVVETWRRVWGDGKFFGGPKISEWLFGWKISIFAAKIFDDLFLVIDQIF